MKLSFFLNLLFILCLPCILLISCNKESFEENKNSAVANESSLFQPLSASTVNYLFSFGAKGPFTISPVSATVVKINQEMQFESATPFKLLSGIVQGYDDLTITTFPERFFNGTFSFYGKGNDSLFATVTVQTSIFSDPIDPANGDFFGSEDFTGTFHITGGTGHYLKATGSGTYTAHSEWHPPTMTGTFFSGFTTVNGIGTISVLARNGHTEQLAH